MEKSEIMEQLNLCGKPLSKGHKRIVQFIEEHPEKAAFMTAITLAAHCDVSESTVVRFASAMGYEGYPEMQTALKGLIHQRLTASQRFKIAAEINENDVLKTVLNNDMRNIRQTMEELSDVDFEAAVEKIGQARRIYVMGLRSAAPLAQFLSHYLHLIFDDVMMVANTTGDVFDEIERITEKDVLIGISFPRYSTRTVECMRFARKSGATVVAVTDSAVSPVGKQAEICLTSHTDMASFVDSLAAPLSVLNALVVALSLKHQQQLKDHLERLENIWSDHGVYIDKDEQR